MLLYSAEPIFMKFISLLSAKIAGGHASHVIVLTTENHLQAKTPNNEGHGHKDRYSFF